MNPSILNTIEQWLSPVFLLVLLVVGVVSHTSYGIAWDEPMQRNTGRYNYQYVKGLNNDLLSYEARDYGVAMELPLYALEKVFSLESDRDVYRMRHLLNHLFFLFSAALFFLLLKDVFGSRWIAFLGLLFLVCHPRIYGHSFFNSKDIPFLSWTIVVFFFWFRNLKNPNHLNALLVGIAMGLAANVRIMGIMFWVYFVFLEIGSGLVRSALRQAVLRTGIAVISALLTLYLFWPNLWEAPLENFVTAFKNMAKFRWDLDVLFRGEVLSGKDVPWYYLIWWFGITTPLMILIAGGFGLTRLLIDLVRKKTKVLAEKPDLFLLLALISFIGPLVAVIVFNSVLYDSWRQVFFIYPAFIVLALYGTLKISDLFPAKIALITGLIALLCVPQLVHSWSNLPTGYVYFNLLTSKGEKEQLRKNYELDYWGESYYPALKHLLKEIPEGEIKIAVANSPGRFNLFLLTDSHKSRLKVVEDLNEADFFITNYRWHPADYDIHPDKSWHRIEMYNSTIVEIFKMN